MNLSRVAKAGICGLVASVTLPMMSAFATPSLGPNDMSFYSPPTVATGNHGDLIWYRSTTVNLGNEAPAVKAWNVLYHSTDALGAANAVTGTVIVPSTAWSGKGVRPVISYAVGTHGLAQDCAPSIQMAKGSDYENANLAAALNAGYAVLVTDNPGYTTGDTPTYMTGAAQGHALLDIFKAATQIPNVGISASAKDAIWGYSQGGQTSAWAGELQPTYMPNLNLVAVASGGTPADFIETAHYLDGSTGSSFMFEAVIGLAQQYPNDIPLYDLANATGQQAIVKGKSECVFQALFDFMNDDLSMFTQGNKTLDQLLTQLPATKQRIEEQQLGTKKMPVPLYLYHGQADEFIPLDQDYALKQAYCAKNSNVTFALYPSEHIVTQFQAADSVLSWLGDRFNGKFTAGTCHTYNPAPVSNANPGGGDFVVSLKEWPLTASMHLKTLAQTVKLPDTSTFTADANVTSSDLEGTMNIPTFFTKLWIVLPLDVQLSVVATQPTVGTAGIDNDGYLHIHGTAYADVKVKSAGLSIIQIPFGCKTQTAVPFPIDFDGPVSSLGGGKMTFSGTTTFPPMRNCGLFNGLFTVLMSGPGQTYSFNVAPPAPKTL